MTSRSRRAAAFLDKGGTGKTTTIAHLGVALADAGHDVVMIDLAGKQADLAKNFGVWEEYERRIADEDDWPNISTVFREQWSRIAERLGDEAVDEMLFDTGEGPDLIPAHPGLDGLDSELNEIEDTATRYSRLDDFVSEYLDPRGYDVVLFDLPGSTNNISYNGLWAARHVVVPVEAGPFESKQADRLRDDLERITESFPVDVDLSMLVLNKVDQRTNLADDFLEAFGEDYPDAVAPEAVPRSQAVRNAAVDGQTLFANGADTATAERARDAFRDNADALIGRLGGEEGR